ncbi:MAG: hypothetical protein AB1668_07040, partial [Nanoarchaeota archaeon]
MEKCILCSSEVEQREIDEGLFFDKTQHSEYNLNIIAAGMAVYIEIRDSMGNCNTWHIDTGDPKDTLNDLKEKIGNALK